MKTVTIQKLSKTYLSGKEALKELSLTLSTAKAVSMVFSVQMVPERRQP